MRVIEQGTSSGIDKDAENEDYITVSTISSFFNDNIFTTGNYKVKKRSTELPYERFKELNSTHLPTGIIPRIEYSKKNLDFLSKPFGSEYIMLNIDVVKRLADQGLTARDIYPYGDIITTSTIQDSVLCNFNVEQEIEVITKFKPAWHIPCDYPTYYEDCDEGREWFIDAVVEDTISFIEAVKGTSIEVLPLIKGINESEWKRSVSQFKNMGINYFAFYVKQYFGSHNGKNDQLMVEHIRRMVYSCHPDYLMLIGYQSPIRVRDMPPEVKAFAGKRWVIGSKINDVSPEQARIEFLDWKSQFEEQNIVRQSVLKFEDEILSKEVY